MVVLLFVLGPVVVVVGVPDVKLEKKIEMEGVRGKIQGEGWEREGEGETHFLQLLNRIICWAGGKSWGRTNSCIRRFWSRRGR